jgi:hypothetical protein
MATILDSLLFTASGIFFRIQGGWLLSLLTYVGVSLLFMNGLNRPVFRSRVTSRKWTTLRFASIVIESWLSLKFLQIFCLIISNCLGLWVLTCEQPVEWNRCFVLCCHEFSCCQSHARLSWVARMLPGLFDFGLKNAKYNFFSRNRILYC